MTPPTKDELDAEAKKAAEHLFGKHNTLLQLGYVLQAYDQLRFDYLQLQKDIESVKREREWDQRSY